jgi:hypothetical protein
VFLLLPDSIPRRFVHPSYRSLHPEFIPEFPKNNIKNKFQDKKKKRKLSFEGGAEMGDKYMPTAHVLATATRKLHVKRHQE